MDFLRFGSKIKGVTITHFLSPIYKTKPLYTLKVTNLFKRAISLQSQPNSLLAIGVNLR